MRDQEPIDRLAAQLLVRDLVSAIFKSGQVRNAMRLMTADLRQEWANDWVVGELEFGEGRLQWTERGEVTDALASMDHDHRLWPPFASETLATWQKMWATLPDALENRGSEILVLRWHRTLEDLRQSGGEWKVHAPTRTGPVRVRVDLEDRDGTLLIADVNVDG